MTNQRAGSLRERIIDRFLSDLGITREHVKKATELFDTVDVKKTSEGVEINIKLKKIQVKIDTE